MKPSKIALPILILLLVVLIMATAIYLSIIYNSKNIENTTMQIHTINLTIGDKTFTATLEDNATARELVKILPLDISMSELNGNEKYYYLDTPLSSTPAKIDTIHTGDIMLYGDDCLVLFYDTIETPYQYTRLGHLDNPADLKDALGKSDIDIYIALP